MELDSFASRHGGLRGRQGARQKDASLCHYLKYFLNNEICIHHDKFSLGAGTLIMAIRALSFFVGGHKYPKNTYKIIFVKRDIALKVFNYVPEEVPMRSSALGVLSGYIDLSKRRSTRFLDPYDRKKFLHDNTTKLVFKDNVQK